MSKWQGSYMKEKWNRIEYQPMYLCRVPLLQYQSVPPSISIEYLKKNKLNFEDATTKNRMSRLGQN